MNVALIPVAQTCLDWPAFQSVTLAALGRSVTAPHDARAVRDRGLAAAVVAVGEFRRVGCDYMATLRDAGELLKHFSVALLGMCDDLELLLEIASGGDLRICLCDDEEKLFLVSGSLEQWRTSLINFAGPRASPSHRGFTQAALAAFDKMGLGRIWENYSRSGEREAFALAEKR